MKVCIAAVGRLRGGAEADLLADYISRFEKTGRNLGLGPVTLREVEAKKGGPDAEAKLLAKAVAGTQKCCVLDERGQIMSSTEFSKLLGKWRDEGQNDIAFVIGGADGLDHALREKADFSLSFGRMVWPHMLVRVMLAEQLYRAATILAGGPYHRS